MSKKTIIKYFIACLVILFFVFLIKERSFNYGYCTTADYSYSFDSKYATIVYVTVKNGFIELPVLDGNYNTAFLEVELRQGILGYLFQPEIDMLYDTLYSSQYFESGAKGIRYLNLSGFVQVRAKRIILNCYRCNIPDNSYRLILYKNRDVKKERVLVLSPHPDDAEIAAFGLYSSSKNTFIATITAGDAGKSKYEDFYKTNREHYLKKGTLRFWNSITVPLLAGLSQHNIVNLGYFDGSLKLMYFNNTLTATSKFIGINDICLFRSKNISTFLDSLKATSSWCSLVNDLKYILQKRNPTIIVTPYPAIDTHYDHKCTSIALLQAMKELHYAEAELWMYTNHFSNSELYPVGKMGSAVSMPPYFKTPGIYFDKINSLPLSKDVQIDKLFALDAMNDLRHNTEWNTISDLFYVLYRKIADIFFQQDKSYYRKSVRANELFFVIAASKIYDDKFYKKIVGQVNQKDK